MNKKIWFTVILLLTTSMLFAFGAKEKDEPVTRVTGIVRLVGSSLFSEIVITNEETQWFIAKEETEKLFDLQHRTVIVEGIETVTEIFFANGHSAGFRRELKSIKIIKVE